MSLEVGARQCLEERYKTKKAHNNCMRSRVGERGRAISDRVTDTAPSGSSDRPRSGRMHGTPFGLKMDGKALDLLHDVNDILITRQGFLDVPLTNAARVRFAQKNGMRPVLKAYGGVYFRIIGSNQNGVLNFDYTETMPSFIEPMIEGETVGARIAVRYLGVTKVELSCFQVCGDGSKPIALAALNKLRGNGGPPVKS